MNLVDLVQEQLGLSPSGIDMTFCALTKDGVRRRTKWAV